MLNFCFNIVRFNIFYSVFNLNSISFCFHIYVSVNDIYSGFLFGLKKKVISKTFPKTIVKVILKWSAHNPQGAFESPPGRCHKLSHTCN